MSERTAKITIEYVVVEKRTIEASGKGLAKIEKALKPYLENNAILVQSTVESSSKPLLGKRIVVKRRGKKPGPKPKGKPGPKAKLKFVQAAIDEVVKKEAKKFVKRKYEHSPEWIAKHKKVDAMVERARERIDPLVQQMGSAKLLPYSRWQKKKAKPNPDAFPEAYVPAGPTPKGQRDPMFDRDMKQAVKFKEKDGFETDQEDEK